MEVKKAVVELDHLFVQAQAGDLDAYGQIVRRYQDMAVGYAYSILGDFHLAEDASQEAFIETYLHLGKLYGPAVFPGWLRRAVFKHCDRITRRKRVVTIPLDGIPEVPSRAPPPDQLVASHEIEKRVARAIRSLPEGERTATALFYMGGYSQREIATFLEIPAKTVKSRLHTARNRLRERMLDMVEDQLRSQRPSRDASFEVKVIDDLALLTDFEVQRILREVNIGDLIVALKGTGTDVQERVYANVSKGIATLLKNEMAISGPLERGEIEATRARIVALAQQLVPAESKVDLGSKEYLKVKEELQGMLAKGPFSEAVFEEIGNFFFTMAEVCRMAGISSLRDATAGADEALFNLGLQLMLDGTEPPMIETILKTHMRALMHDHTTRSRMIVEGLTAIKSGSYPAVIDLRLRRFHVSEQVWSSDYPEGPAQVVKEKLEEKSLDEFSLDELTEFLVDVSVAVRTEGISVLAELAELADDELLARGLEVMQMFGGNVRLEWVHRMLEIHMTSLLRRREIRYEMITEGFKSIQAGENPYVIARKMTNFYE